MAQQSEQETNSKIGTTSELRKEFRLFEVLSLGMNVVLALVGIGALCIYSGQLDVMRGTLQNIVTQTKTMQGTLDQMKSGSVQTDRLIFAATGIAGSMADSLHKSDIARTASERQNAMAINAGIEQSRLDQRAWISIVDLRTTREPAVGEDLSILYTLINSGKTPAVGVSTKGEFSIQTGELPTPDWSSVTAQNEQTIFPGTRINDIISVIPATTFTKTVIDAYSNLVTNYRINYRVRVDYADAFGQHHWIETCSLHHFGTKLDGFIGCKVGTVIDTTEPTKNATKP